MSCLLLMMVIVKMTAIVANVDAMCPTTIEKGMRITKSAYKHVSATTAETCCAACAQEHPQCNAWVLSSNISSSWRCALKSDPGHSEPDPDSSYSGRYVLPPSFDLMFQGGAVLQRDTKDVPVWGTSNASEVSLYLDEKKIATVPVSASGQWKVYLEANAAAYNRTLTVADTSGNVSVIVSFGEVLICAGQSNMGMQVGPSERGFDADNGTAESAAAGRYTGRIWLRSKQSRNPNATSWFTVTPESLPSFSAVCWYTGKSLFESLGGEVPFGMIMSAVGAHAIESWLSHDSLSSCNISTVCIDGQPLSKIWESQIIPMLPFKVGTMIWDQAEADLKCNRTYLYPCLQEALVTSWRDGFNSSFPFAAVQLPGYKDGVFPMRLQQEVGVRSLSNAVVVPTYDLSCAMDKEHGCPHGNVHNVDKVPVGYRLALEIRRLKYGEKLVTEGPRVTQIEAKQLTKAKYNVTIIFTGGTQPLYFKGTRNCTACCNTPYSDFDVSADLIQWVNGTNAVVTSPMAISFIVSMSVAPKYIRYTANNVFPQCAVYNQEGLPAFPFQMVVKSVQEKEY